VIKAALWLIIGTVAFWGLLTYPARLLWPDVPTFLWSTTAAVLCLAPTVLTMVWTRWAFQGKPEQQMLAVFGGAGLRMVVVLAVGMGLFLGVEPFQHQRFGIMVVVYYLFTLALEMILIVRNAPAEQVERKS